MIDTVAIARGNTIKLDATPKSTSQPSRKSGSKDPPQPQAQSVSVQQAEPSDEKDEAVSVVTATVVLPPGTEGPTVLVVGPGGAVYNVPIPAGVEGARFEVQLPTLPPTGLELVASTKWYLSRKTTGFGAWEGPKTLKQLYAANSASRCCRQSDFGSTEPVALDRIHTVASVLASASAQGVANLRVRLPAAPLPLMQTALRENDFDVNRAYAALRERLAQGASEATAGTRLSGTAVAVAGPPQFVSRKSGRFIFLSSDTGDATTCEWDEAVVARAVAAAEEAKAKAAEAQAEALNA